MKGELKVVAGAGKKLRAAMTNVLPDSTPAEMHRKTARPGSAKHPDQATEVQREAQRPAQAVRVTAAPAQIAANFQDVSHQQEAYDGLQVCARTMLMQIACDALACDPTEAAAVLDRPDTTTMNWLRLRQLRDL